MDGDGAKAIWAASGLSSIQGKGTGTITGAVLQPLSEYIEVLIVPANGPRTTSLAGAL